jgi:alkylation response protein AidB-like acyl-CoA dehydrogenase
MARAFGEAEIAPHAQDWDKAGEIPKDLWPKLAELGFGGLYVSETAGGSGPHAARCDAGLRGARRSCASVAAFLSIHNMCARMLDKRLGRGLARPASCPGAEDGDRFSPTA